MLEISTFMASPGGGNTAGKLDDTSEVGVVGSIIDGFREEERRRSGEEGDRNSVGNRWPRQETLALLKIRSDMDVAFRDSALKGPLWEEISRKLAELGYHRSAKKCKEKFENVYKYHKRTKEGRASKPNGRIYRFFDQLEALHNQLSVQPENKRTPATTLTAMPATNPIAIAPLNSAPLYLQNLTADFTSASTASSSSSGEESEGTRKKNIKWEAFFDGLMKELIEKQESLQKKFLEAIEKRERDRMVREEAWKMQEMERMNRRHEILVQERSIAAAKDAALTAFLQKISEQSNPVQLQENSSPSDKTLDNNRQCDHGEISVRRVDSTVNLGFGSSSSRWPNAEVQALIKLRTSLDLKYHETGPKGPFWEEISSAMRKLGYDRSAKRCKEKWENINKYFKKVKESKKRRPEDSKTCPYFHQLDALYREKTKKIDNSSKQNGFGVKVEDLVVQMMTSTEQREDQLGQKSAVDDPGDENVDQNQEEEDGDDGGEAENVVANNPSSVVIE